MAITIYDIAKATNKTHATVSMAMRNDPRISEETRKRICRVAKELGYRPSHAGKLLKAGKTHTIGLILPEFTNPYYIEFLNIFQAQCIAKGYQAVPMSFDMDPKRERQCLEQMLERRCDGIVTFLTRFGPLKALVEEFWTSQMPFVVVGLPGDIGEVHIDGLRININTGMEKAVDHLVSLGHREIVMVASWPAESNTGADRFPGLKEGFRKNGIPFSDDNIFFHYTGNQLHDGHVAARELLRRRPKTTAVIGVNDILITGFMRSLLEMGLKVPGDISLIGTDNTWIGQEWPVSLTTIDQKTPELAQKAVETLFLRMNSQEWDEPRHIYLETDLIVRESTGPVRQG